MPALSSARRSELRAKAHALSPVVMIGDKGLTATVLLEVDRALKAHELIKVKAATDEREARAGWMAEICEKLGAHAVQVIGKVLVIWRENPEKAPAPRQAPAKRPAKPKATARKKPALREERVRAPREPKRTPMERSRATAGPRGARPRPGAGETAPAVTRTSRRRSRTP